MYILICTCVLYDGVSRSFRRAHQEDGWVERDEHGVVSGDCEVDLLSLAGARGIMCQRVHGVLVGSQFWRLCRFSCLVWVTRLAPRCCCFLSLGFLGSGIEIHV